MPTGKDKGKYEKDNSWLNWIIVGKVDWLWSGGRRASDRLSGNALPPKARRSKGSLIFHSSFLTRMSNFDPSHLIFVFMFRWAWSKRNYSLPWMSSWDGWCWTRWLGADRKVKLLVEGRISEDKWGLHFWGQGSKEKVQRHTSLVYEIGQKVQIAVS